MNISIKIKWIKSVRNEETSDHIRSIVGKKPDNLCDLFTLQSIYVSFFVHFIPFLSFLCFLGSCVFSLYAYTHAERRVRKASEEIALQNSISFSLRVIFGCLFQLHWKTPKIPWSVSNVTLLCGCVPNFPEFLFHSVFFCFILDDFLFAIY